MDADALADRRLVGGISSTGDHDAGSKGSVLSGKPSLVYTTLAAAELRRLVLHSLRADKYFKLTEMSGT